MKLLPSSCRGLLLTSLALHASAALAHAGYPDTTSVTIRRDHPEDMLLGATFGAVVSHDSGKSWSWLCPEAMAYGGWRPETYLWEPNGDLLAATGAALIRSRDGACTWQEHPYFKSQGLWPMGLESPASNPSRLWVATGRSSAHNGLYRSDDGGETFAPVPNLQSDTAIYTAVKVAPSDTRRLYVSGASSDGLHLYRSDDEGTHWVDIPQPFPEYSTTTRPYDLFVLRVSDNDPDHLWARVSGGAWTYVLESKDGGHTFQSVLHPENQTEDGIDEYLIGIEVSADANTLWAATPTRLFRRHAGDTTAQLLSLPQGNACVLRAGSVLWVCGATRIHDWALATTTDEGATYTPLYNLPDTQAPSCPVGTPVHDICRSFWPQFAPTIEANPTLPPDPPGQSDGGTPDAGAVEQPPTKKHGCSSTDGLLPSACLLTLTALRRSRRHHPENPT
ncbi:MAG: WD40/YVTN/BNR-like repeat-containing protein [Archangium sp.]